MSTDLLPSPQGSEERLWTVEDVVRYLGVGKTSLYELMAEGLPSVMLAGRRRFVPQKVKLYVEAL